MRRAFGTACLVAMCGAAVAAQDGAAKDKAATGGKDESRPEIALKVTPLIAFSPAKITVRAEFKGGATDYEPFYCTTIVWD